MGAAGGGAAGGLAGKGVAEKIDPTVEHEYSRGEYSKRPYVTKGSPHDQYGPAYEYGWESYSHCTTKNAEFTDVEPELQQNWESHRGTSPLDWEHARDATKDAWDRAAKHGSGHCC